MRIVVNDIAASCGGALTILLQFYNYIRQNDQENEWIFLLGEQLFQETDRIKIIVCKEIKQSHLRKMWFDIVSGSSFIEKLAPDIVISLQNIITFGVKVPQLVYVHQSIPFQKIRKFSFFKKEERNLAFIQYCIGFLIKKSIVHADRIIVQTKWMKEAVASQCNIHQDRVEIVFPEVEKFSDSGNSYQENLFFYPTNNEIYKNIQCIIDACNLLNDAGFTKFQVDLTLPENTVRHENVRCIGYLDKSEMKRRYSDSTLLFPSYIETVGLPLLEARMSNSLVLAADTEFARECLDRYENAFFFEWNKPEKLAGLMRRVLEHKICRKISVSNVHRPASWNHLLDVIDSFK